MSRLVSTVGAYPRGDSLTPATGLTGGTNVYAFAAIPVADEVVVVIDLEPGIEPNLVPDNDSPLNTNPRLLAVPVLSMADGAAAFDFTLAGVGFDTLPATKTAAGYRSAGDIVFPAKRYTQVTVLEGAINQPALVLHRYVAFILSPHALGVAPAVDVTIGLRFMNWLDNMAYT